MSTIVIKEESCKGCQYCVLSCPRGLIQVDDGVINEMGYNPVKFTDNPERPCVGCALCAEVCPDVLIEVYREKGGEEIENGGI